MPVTLPQIKSLLVDRTEGTVFAYLNCHMYIVFMVVFTLVGRLTPGNDLLVCCSQWFIFAGITIITGLLLS